LTSTVLQSYLQPTESSKGTLRFLFKFVFYLFILLSLQFGILWSHRWSLCCSGISSKIEPLTP